MMTTTFKQVAHRIVNAHNAIIRNQKQCASIARDLQAKYGTAWKYRQREMESNDIKQALLYIDLQVDIKKLRDVISTLEAHHCISCDYLLREIRKLDTRQKVGV